MISDVIRNFTHYVLRHKDFFKVTDTKCLSPSEVLEMSFNSFFNSFSDFDIFFHVHGFAPFWRRFYSHQERLEQLEKYKELLEKELAAVKEAIDELKRKI